MRKHSSVSWRVMTKTPPRLSMMRTMAGSFLLF
nr:MAG TPA: hypothetical protein [Caudoviricetes sp.]